MINPDPQSADVWAGLRLGIPVDRPTSTLPQGTNAALFTVSGGRVAILGITGEVTTAVQATANAAKLIATPAVGTAVDMCAALDITGDEVGCLYGITGIPADALIGANAGLGALLQRPQVVNTGTIRLGCVGSATGAIKWQIRYLPLDVGATIVAA